MAKKSQSFEQSITRLDEIVRQLEQGNVPLEDALKLFQEGTALVDTCGTPAETEYERNDV